MNSSLCLRLILPLLCLLISTFDCTAQEQTIEDREQRIRIAMEPATEYLRKANGHALLVYKNDFLIYEEYLNGHESTQPHVLASGTKSFSAALLNVAQQDGLLTLDEKVSDTITEWKTRTHLSEVTIRDLLSLTSGIDPGPTGRVPIYAIAIKANALEPPGTKFQYGPIPYQVFGELMRRKLAPQDENVDGYLTRRVFDPIGMKVALWRKGPDGQPHMPSGIFLTAREWAKYGLLICNRGVHEGKPLLDQKLLEECFQGSKAQPGYGITFWLNRTGVGPDDMVMAAGKGKQKLYISPSTGVVIVQFAQTAAPEYKEEVFLNKLPKRLWTPRPIASGN